MILRKLSACEYPVCFKGGTSLLKAYSVIDRFSADIDITFTDHLGENRRKKLKYNILKPIADDIGLEITNWDSIESDKEHSYKTLQKIYSKRTASGPLDQKLFYLYSAEI